MRKKRMYVCSVEAAMDVIGGKWKPLILWKIKDTPLRFGEIQKKLPNISQKMLTRQLRALEEDPVSYTHLRRRRCRANSSNAR